MDPDEEPPYKGKTLGECFVGLPPHLLVDSVLFRAARRVGQSLVKTFEDERADRAWRDYLMPVCEPFCYADALRRQKRAEEIIGKTGGFDFARGPYPDPSGVGAKSHHQHPAMRVVDVAPTTEACRAFVRRSADILVDALPGVLGNSCDESTARLALLLANVNTLYVIAWEELLLNRVRIVSQTLDSGSPEPVWRARFFDGRTIRLLPLEFEQTYFWGGTRAPHDLVRCFTELSTQVFGELATKVRHLTLGHDVSEDMHRWSLVYDLRVESKLEPWDISPSPSDPGIGHKLWIRYSLFYPEGPDPSVEQIKQ